MRRTVYRVLRLLCELVEGLPIGTNLGLLQVLWMLVSGRLLAARGAVLPGLSATGLSEAAVRRAWAALGQGRWTSGELLRRWEHVVEREGRWQAHEQGGYRPVAADLTATWRPRLVGCPTTHYDTTIGQARPAIPLGVVARVGGVGDQRLGLPVALVRADRADPGWEAHRRALGEAAAAALQPGEVLVADGEFEVRLLQAAGVGAYVVRGAKNLAARRAQPAAYVGRGARPKRGVLVRPLARTYRGRVLPATPPDRVEVWRDGVVEVRAECWDDLVPTDAPRGGSTFRVVALRDPRHRAPLLLATSLPVAVPSRILAALYAERWPVEHLPLVAKQLLGAARQFVSEPETCQRLPELALLAGAVLAYAAATQPAVPSGFWDRHPRPTAGRLRRGLGQVLFPTTFPFPARIREKASVTTHLPTGFWGQRRRLHAGLDPDPAPRTSRPTSQAA